MQSNSEDVQSLEECNQHPAVSGAPNLTVLAEVTSAVAQEAIPPRANLDTGTPAETDQEVLFR